MLHFEQISIGSFIYQSLCAKYRLVLLQKRYTKKQIMLQMAD